MSVIIEFPVETNPDMTIELLTGVQIYPSSGSSVDGFIVQAGDPPSVIPDGVYTYLDTDTGKLYKAVSGEWELVYTIGQGGTPEPDPVTYTAIQGYPIATFNA